MAETTKDPVAAKIQAIWAAKQAAGWTYQQLGEAMDYRGDGARWAAQQFLRSSDPRISSVRRFAKAVGISPRSLL